MGQLFSCCCPASQQQKSRSRARRSGSTKLKEDEIDEVALPAEGLPDEEDSRPPPPPYSFASDRRLTVHARRRAAVTSEKSEQMANTRWQSAFEAIRRSESKSDERLGEITSVLREHDLFAQWDEPLLRKVAQAMREKLVREGDAIITQGEAGDNFYVVVEGECGAYIADEDGEGEGACVQTYSHGASFGELALLYDTPRAATVKCTSRAALLYKLGRIAFRNLVSASLLDKKIGLERHLRQVPILRGLSPESISQLVHALETCEYEGGEYIIEQGAEAGISPG